MGRITVVKTHLSASRLFQIQAELERQPSNFLLCGRVSRVKELEDALAKERAESKKALDDAKNSAAPCEKDFAERLASLTRDVGGKFSLFAYFLLRNIIVKQGRINQKVKGVTSL